MRYVFYNANPKGLFTDDCVCRAISVAEGISWEKCHQKLSDLSRQEGKILNDVGFVENYLDKRYPRMCYDNMTIGEFSKIAPKGHFVATMNGHITAIIDNVIVDTFDCSDRIIKCCWQIM
jgi:hypothetical protein